VSGDDTILDRDVRVLSTRIPERGTVAGVRYGAHVVRASQGLQGYYVTLDGKTWGVAWTTPASDELPEREDGESRDEAIVRAIREELASVTS